MKGFKIMLIGAIFGIFTSRAVLDDIPPDPHLFFNEAERCSECHESDFSGENISEHDFVIEIIENCRECHPEEKLGRSHPVGVNPDEKYPDMDVPDDLPLNNDWELTCGTCHNPHLPGFSTNSYIDRQKPLFILSGRNGGRREAYYKTYYLRIKVCGEGFTPLCHSCHEDY